MIRIIIELGRKKKKKLSDYPETLINQLRSDLTDKQKLYVLENTAIYGPIPD